MEFEFSGKKIEQLDFKEFCAFLKKNGSAKKAKFDKKIIKTKQKIYGLYAGDIEKIYKYLSKIESKILTFPQKVYEITLLQGLLIVGSKKPLSEKKIFFDNWLFGVDNWGHCDMVVGKFKCAKQERESLFSYAIELLSAPEEFRCRCGAVLLFDFLDDEHLTKIFDALNMVEYGRYYVDMAVSWLCATALIDYKKETLDFLENSQKINDFVYLKTLQKARESYRISPEDKEEYRQKQRQRR